MTYISHGKRSIMEAEAILATPGRSFEVYPEPGGVEINRFAYAVMEATCLKMTLPGDTEARVPFALIEFICERGPSAGVIRLTRPAALVRGCLL